MKIVDKNNNTYHKIITMLSFNVKLSMDIEYDVKHIEKDPKFKTADHVRISSNKNNFAKGSVVD